MRFVRENLFYVILVAVVIAVGALAAFYYTGSGIDKSVKDRTSVSKQLVDLNRQPLKVDANAVRALQNRIDALAKANKADLQACLDFNKRNLPVLKIPHGTASEVDAVPFDLKRYRDESLNIPFIDRYHQTLGRILAQPLLKATIAPTEEQITAEVEKMTDKFKDENPAEVRDRAARSVIIKHASAGLIYAEESALDRVLPVGLKTAPGTDKLWESQVNLWVTDEIIRAIGKANQQWIASQRADSGADIKEAVPNSAISHLVKLDITEAVAAAGSGSSSSSVGKTSLSRRETNAQHMVVPYKIDLIMPTRHIRLLIDTLESQNYHTITNVTIAELQRTGKELHYYGTVGVMKVRLDGELLLLADWIRDLVPAEMAGRFGKVAK